jgi:hypothetical protein
VQLRDHADVSLILWRQHDWLKFRIDRLEQDLCAMPRSIRRSGRSAKQADVCLAVSRRGEVEIDSTRRQGFRAPLTYLARERQTSPFKVRMIVPSDPLRRPASKFGESGLLLAEATGCPPQAGERHAGLEGHRCSIIFRCRLRRE